MKAVGHVRGLTTLDGVSCIARAATVAINAVRESQGNRVEVGFNRVNYLVGTDEDGAEYKDAARAVRYFGLTARMRRVSRGTFDTLTREQVCIVGVWSDRGVEHAAVVGDYCRETGAVTLVNHRIIPGFSWRRFKSWKEFKDRLCDQECMIVLPRR